MISFINLFELVSTVQKGKIAPSNVPPAPDPMGEVKSYYLQRLNSLKRMVSSGRISQTQFTQLSKELRSNKFNKGFGTVTF